MYTYTITCCSTADLPKEYLEEKGVPYACFHVNMDNDQYPDDLGQTIPYEEFYARIAAGAMPTTSQVNVAEFTDFFGALLAKGQDILHLSLSSGLSGAYSAATIAAQQLAEEYPGRSIRVVDTLGASSGYGLILDTALEMRENGATLDELADWLEQNKLDMHHWFFSGDLSHFKRGGRISGASATMGTLLGICPLMNMNDKGELIQRKKVRGKKHVIEQMVQKMEQHAKEGVAYTGKCFISQSACYEDARAVADLIESRFPYLNGKVMINNIGSVIGAHTGPGTVALFFWGDTRNDWD